MFQYMMKCDSQPARKADIGLCDTGLCTSLCILSVISDV